MELKEAIDKLNNLIKNANIEDIDMNDIFGGEHIEAIDTVLEELDRLHQKDEKIRENFLKYDWKNSNTEQIYNQLKDLYESIYGVEILNKE